MIRWLTVLLTLTLFVLTCGIAAAQQPAPPPPDESALGELVIPIGTTGTVPLPKIGSQAQGIWPNWKAAM